MQDKRFDDFIRNGLNNLEDKSGESAWDKFENFRNDNDSEIKDFDEFVKNNLSGLGSSGIDSDWDEFQSTLKESENIEVDEIVKESLETNTIVNTPDNAWERFTQYAQFKNREELNKIVNRVLKIAAILVLLWSLYPLINYYSGELIQNSDSESIVDNSKIQNGESDNMDFDRQNVQGTESQQLEFSPYNNNSLSPSENVGNQSQQSDNYIARENHRALYKSGALPNVSQLNDAKKSSFSNRLAHLNPLKSLPFSIDQYDIINSSIASKNISLYSKGIILNQDRQLDVGMNPDKAHFANKNHKIYKDEVQELPFKDSYAVEGKERGNLSASPIKLFAGLENKWNIGLYILGRRDIIHSPVDPVYEKDATTGYSNGIGGGINAQYEHSDKFSLSTGLEYNLYSYNTPNIIEFYEGNIDRGYKSVSLKSIEYETISVPVEAQYNVARFHNFNVYLNGGISFNAIAKAYYNIDKETHITGTGHATPAPDDYNFENSDLSKKKFTEGIFQGGNLDNTFFINSNIGVGLDLAASDMFSVFLQGDFSFNLGRQGIGPNQDVMDNASLKAGVRYHM